MIWQEFLLRLLQTVISWPVSAVVLGLIFHKPISQFISLATSLTLKALGAEVTLSQKSADKESAFEQSGDLKLSEEQDELLQQVMQEKDQAVLEKRDALTASQQKDALIEALFHIGEANEFKFLNLLLVPNSKAALAYLSQNPGTAKDYFLHSYGLPFPAADPQAERLAIFNALLSNGLIEEQGSKILLSEKGSRFVEAANLAQ